MPAPAVDVEKKRRVGVFTQRNIETHVARCACYEFEDVIVEDLERGAVFIEPPKEMPSRLHRRAKHWLARKGVPTGFMDAARRPFPVDEDLDLLFFAPSTPYELLTLDAYTDWRRRTRYAVCFIQELWVDEMDLPVRDMGKVLNQFDHVFCSVYHTAEALAKKLDTRVDFMPYGVDSEVFNPFASPHPKPRVIDACAIGAMDPVTHDALWNWAENTGRFYHFSSVGDARFTPTHRVHRSNIVQTLQRSKFFFTYMAKRAMSGQRGTQEEFGMRYFEGAAAGAIQIGNIVTSNPGFMANVDWEGAVVEVPFSAADMPQLIEDIEKDAAWVDATRKRNVVNCLTRHDHLYRWQMVLRSAGLDDSARLNARRQRLDDMAAALSPDETKVRAVK